MRHTETRLETSAAYPLECCPKGTDPPQMRMGKKLDAWHAHFAAVLFAVTTSECTQAYEAGFQVLAQLPAGEASVRTQLGPSVRQVHADWAGAIEAARRTWFPQRMRAGDFRHMWQGIKRTLPSHLSGSSESQKHRLQQVASAVCITRTKCATLTEFHTFWAHMLVAAAASKGAIWVPRLSARQQWRFMCCVVGLIRTAAAWVCIWVAGSGVFPRKCLAACAGGLLRPALDPRGASAVFEAFGRAAKAHGREYQQIDSLSDRPNMADRTVRSGTMLAKVGRSTAVQLFQRKDLVHRIEAQGCSCAYVLPQSLLHWAPTAPARGWAARVLRGSPRRRTAY